MLVIKQLQRICGSFLEFGILQCVFCPANKRACAVQMYPRAKQIKFIDLIVFTLYFNLFLLR